jgi:hypothetical protein
MNYVYLTHSSLYDVAAFTVDRIHQRGKAFGLPVVPFEDIESAYSPNEYKMSLVMSYRKLTKLRAKSIIKRKQRDMS